MDRDPFLDQAIDTAISRTRDAEGAFQEELEPDEVPVPAAAELVVERATDLRDLAQQGAEDEGDEPTAG
jgi:phosphoenolpyruvate-protein kinase (PTS system EI component)